MKKVWNFLSRDVVNTFVLVLTLILGVGSLITSNEVGYFYLLLVVFIIRFMIWHYKLWDKVNDSITDTTIRNLVFGLPPISSTEKARHDVLYTVVSVIIFLAGVAFLVLLTLSLIK